MEFCDLYKRAMLMSDTGADAGGGGGGGRGAERLMGQAVDALRDSEWGGRGACVYGYWTVGHGTVGHTGGCGGRTGSSHRGAASDSIGRCAAGSWHATTVCAGSPRQQCGCRFTRCGWGLSSSRSVDEPLPAAPTPSSVPAPALHSLIASFPSHHRSRLPQRGFPEVVLHVVLAWRRGCVLTLAYSPLPVDARSEASLKQCYNNYCRLVAAGGGRMMMDGDMKMGSGQWHQLCADVGLAAPVGEQGEGAVGGALRQ